MSERSFKKITIASIFFLFIVLVPGVILFLMFSGGEGGENDFHPQPSDIEVMQVQALGGEGGEFDFFAQIKNPNSFFGAPKIKYSFRPKAGTDSALLKTGESFILPGQTKYIIETGVPGAERNPEDIILNIDAVEWEHVSRYQAPSLWIADKSYRLVDQGPHYAQISGTLINDSFFDFERVFIKGIFIDNKGEVVAVSQTIVDDVRSGKKRDFKIFVDHSFPPIEEVKVEPETNIFLNSDFLEKYE